MTLLLWTCCGLALAPAALVVWNLRLLRPPPADPFAKGKVSLLIPARNEETNIAAALESALEQGDVLLEALVLDDDSTDATPEIVRGYAARDARVRLLSGRPLPRAVRGKPHACEQLATAARGDVLVFMDADVRLAPRALARLAAALECSVAAMLSGIPRQVTLTWSEKLVVPLMDFVLCGYLPMALMRSRTLPALGAACGQLVAVKRNAYFAVGGHAAVATRVHDGLALARHFRARGFLTDLVDLSTVATCRMYRSWAELRDGFAKNAREGLGSPRGLLPWTAILGLGHVLPFFVLPWALAVPAYRVPAAAAVLLALATRVLLARRFAHAWRSVVLHPAGVALLVAIQWYARLPRAMRRPLAWKSRPLVR